MMISLGRGLLACVWILLLLSGCVTRPTVAPPLSTDYLIPKSFQLTGRAAVKYAGGGDYIRFEWQANKAVEKIYLNSPMGTHVAEIEVTPDAAIFRQGKAVWKAPDCEQLMDALLKWHFPIKGLHYWILGLAAPGISAQWESKDDSWHLTQSGWHMIFSEYVEVEVAGEMRRVPKRIDANNPDLTIRIVIGDWTLGDLHGAE